MTAEEQRNMQELEAENAALKEKSLVACAPLRSTRRCSSTRRRKGAAFPKSPGSSPAASLGGRWIRPSGLACDYVQVDGAHAGRFLANPQEEINRIYK